MAKAAINSHDTTKTSDAFREPKKSPEKHDENGNEIGNPTPMQPPLGYKKSLSLAEQIGQQVRLAKLEMLENRHLEETEEEADDFNVGDDYEPLSPHENDHVPSVAVLKERAQKLNEQIKEANRRKAIDRHREELGLDPIDWKNPPKKGSPKTEEKTPPDPATT